MRRRHHPGVSGEHPGHVGVDLAGIRAQHGGQSNGGGVRPAPTEGGDIAFRRHALESGHHRDDAGGQCLAQTVRPDLQDLGPGVVGVGDDPGLAPRERRGVDAQPEEGHAECGRRDALTGADQHVVLTRGLIRAHRIGQADQIVGRPAHGTDHGHHVTALAPRPGDVIGDGPDAVGVADRGPAEFLDDQRHPSTLMA
jgi:hypothetical protein